MVGIVEQAASRISQKEYAKSHEEYIPIPEIMVTSSTFVEVQVIGAIKLVQPIEHVLARMGVYDIEKNRNAHGMSSVD